MNTEIINLEINGVEFEAEVEFSFIQGEPAITHLLPEDCCEGSPDEYELNSLCILIHDKGFTEEHDVSFLIYDEDLKEVITQHLVDIKDAN